MLNHKRGFVSSFLPLSKSLTSVIFWQPADFSLGIDAASAFVINKRLFLAPDRTEYTPVTQNTSEESINGNGFIESDVALISRNKKPPQFSNFQKYGTLLVLFAINMLNYMDRFTIVGVLAAVKSEFQIDNKRAGLLQTAFMIRFGNIWRVARNIGQKICQLAS